MMNAIFLYFHQALETRPLRTRRPPLHYLRRLIRLLRPDALDLARSPARLIST